MQLLDLGERRLINEVLRARYAGTVWRFGDDAAVVFNTRDYPDCLIVATTDPGPTPVVVELGDPDPYHYGWLTAAVNLSDIAAAGAVPVGLLISLILPNTMSLEDFGRLLDGFDDCCASVGTKVVGGNVKEGTAIHCEATAVGVVPASGEPLSRSGARPGDLVCAIGDTGFFWAGMLTYGRPVPGLTARQRDLIDEALVKPKPQVAVAGDLRRQGLVSACTDNSDGLYGAFRCLALGSGVGIQFEPEMLDVDASVAVVAAAVGEDPVRLALGFGDLQLVCTLRRSRVEDVRRLCQEHGVRFTLVGSVVSEPGVHILTDGECREMSDFDNERFTLGSQFTAGIEGYRKRLFRQPL